jgi:hypothetical protein
MKSKAYVMAALGEFQVIRLPVIFEIRMPMVNKN